jgi:hypothetical protein
MSAGNADSNSRADRVINNLGVMAVPMEEHEFSLETYNKLFPDGKIDTPIGEVKIGENQYKKLQTRDQGKRSRYLGSMYQTLKEPIVIIKQKREKDAYKPSWLYIKSFIQGNKAEIIISVVVSQFDNIQNKPIKVSISTHPKELKPVTEEIKKPDVIVYERQ